MAENLKSNIAIRPKKGYKLYLIRNTKDYIESDLYRHLRASRNFDVSTSSIFKKQEVDPRISDRIKTHLSSYVYIQKDDYVEEYKVVYKDINVKTIDSETIYTVKHGDILETIAKNHNTTVKKIVDYNGIVEKDDIKVDTDLTIIVEKTSSAKIPTVHYEKVIGTKKDKKYEYVYEKARRSIHIDLSYEKVKVYYVNTKLARTDKKTFTSLDKFKGTEIGLAKISNNAFFTKEVDYLELPELTIQDLSNNLHINRPSKDIISVVAILDDELGLVEDLYNYYETNFKTNYSENIPIIKEIKEKNSYVYGISKQINYFYVSKEKEKEYSMDLGKLRLYYDTFKSEILNNRFIPNLFDDDNSVLACSIVPHFHIAKKYQEHIALINISFFHWNIGHYFGFAGRQTKSRRHEEIEDMYKAMKKHKLYDTDPNNFLSLIIFSVLFSGEYDDQIKKNTRLFNARNDFYILLNNMKALPPIDEDAIKNIRSRIDKQDTYKEMFNSDNSLLTQYENLDHINKQVSLSFNEKKQITDDTRLDKLFISSSTTTFKEYEKAESPLNILEQIAAYLKDNEGI
ncbi:MAG: LysM peptidoglycan-binding domain-containing protein, partial [Flavobacteriaceae bacterium]|nr:LysM peptidoglycan-binding domain-containing protein [Flavobacteriaceae bacterium]